MALSAFDDESKKPKTKELENTLGRTYRHWNDLLTHIAAEYAATVEYWNFFGAKWGWSLQLKQKKRTVLYMTPCLKHFLVGFVLGEKAVKAAHKSALAKSAITIIDEAPKYAEGRAVRLEIRNKNDLEDAKKLAAVKMEN
jgi:hypothetical protein